MLQDTTKLVKHEYRCVHHGGRCTHSVLHRLCAAHPGTIVVANVFACANMCEYGLLISMSTRVICALCCLLHVCCSNVHFLADVGERPKSYSAPLRG
jgi:hypothetical protein